MTADLTTALLGGADSGMYDSATTDTLTITNIHEGHEAYGYWDIGSEAIDDISYKFILNITQEATLLGSQQFEVFSAGDTIDDGGGRANNLDGITLQWIDNPAFEKVLILTDKSTGDFDRSVALSLSTDYYIEIARSGTSLIVYIRTTSHMGPLVDTLTLTILSTDLWQYLYLFSSWGAGPSTDDLDLTIREVESNLVGATLGFRVVVKDGATDALEPGYDVHVMPTSGPTNVLTESTDSNGEALFDIAAATYTVWAQWLDYLPTPTLIVDTGVTTSHIVYAIPE